MYVYTYVCMYVCIYVYTYIYVCMYVYDACMYVCMYVCYTYVCNGCRDLGHSQLARYILSEMYVGDLPLIERISYKGESESDDSLSSDEDAKVGSSHSPLPPQPE